MTQVGTRDEEFASQAKTPKGATPRGFNSLQPGVAAVDTGAGVGGGLLRGEQESNPCLVMIDAIDTVWSIVRQRNSSGASPNHLLQLVRTQLHDRFF